MCSLSYPFPTQRLTIPALTLHDINILKQDVFTRLPAYQLPRIYPSLH